MPSTRPQRQVWNNRVRAVTICYNNGKLSQVSSAASQKHVGVVGLHRGPRFCRSERLIGNTPRDEGCGIKFSHRDVSMRVGWDPDNILGPPSGGHISRRMFHRAAQQDASLKKKLEEETAKMKKELDEQRAARVLPTAGNHEAVVQFLLDTETEEMSFEVARVKNCLTREWFEYVQDAARMAKFDSSESYREDRHAELEALAVVVREELDTLEEASSRLIAPTDKLRALFTSKDKKQFILDMAGRNEIDPPFLQLIRQNIRSAEDAGQEDAANFMKKLLDSCKRYETKPKAVKEETAPEIINTSA